MALSLAQRHRLQALASQEAAAASPAVSMAGGTAYEMQLAQLLQDRLRLKQIQSNEGKAALKLQLLPAYVPYVDGVLATGNGAQDEVLTTIMIWRIDASDYSGALDIAAYVLQHSLLMPDRFERTTGCLVAEEVAEAALSSQKTGGGFDLATLHRTMELTAEQDMPDAAIKKMSETIPMATTDIAALVEGGARMGIQGKDDLLEFARVAATAATAFELPADQVGESLARIANLYKLPIKNVSQLGDAINYLDDNAMSKGGDIIDVMQRTAGITASVGMSFKDAAALGSTFLTLGASSEIAATATNAMIRELAIATQQPKRFVTGLKSIGLEAKAVQDGMSKDATGTIQKVLEAVNKLPKNQQLGVMTQLFGKEYGDDAAKLASNIGEYAQSVRSPAGRPRGDSQARDEEGRRTTNGPT